MAARLAQSKAFTESELLSMMKQCLTCLRDLHSQQLCHNTLNPDTLIYNLCTRQYQFRGFHHATKLNAILLQHKQTGARVYNKQVYLPPSLQALRNRQKSYVYDNAAADFYALGVCFLVAKFLTPPEQRTPEKIQQLRSQL